MVDDMLTYVAFENNDNLTTRFIYPFLKEKMLKLRHFLQSILKHGQFSMSKNYYSLYGVT